MFTLVLIDDDIPMKPADFRYDYMAQLKKEIQDKYEDRVIPDVGLCIDFYEFACIKEAHIYPGDGKVACGEAYFKVEFRLIVFRPLIGEWLVGNIVQSTQNGIIVSLGFFQDVLIPSSNLRTPYIFDSNRKCWVWLYQCDETNNTINFFYEVGEMIRFRVISVKFPEECRQNNARQSRMTVIGAVDRDGLGCVSWWPDSFDGDDPATAGDCIPALAGPSQV